MTTRPPEHRTTRRALDVLDRDQDRLLYSGDEKRDPEIKALSGGFSTYWEALVWYQAAGIRTLGHVEDVIAPEHMLPMNGLLERLVDDSTTEGEYVRQRLVEQLDDACDLAYREFRERANEQVESAEEWREDRQDDGEEYEHNPLMRPAFKRLDQSQAAALESLWTGFHSRQRLGRWVRNLSAPTQGEKPSGLLDEIVSSPMLLEALTDRRSREAAAVRYRFAVGLVMPSFFAAARSLNGGERSEAEAAVDKGEFQQG